MPKFLSGQLLSKAISWIAVCLAGGLAVMIVVFALAPTLSIGGAEARHGSDHGSTGNVPMTVNGPPLATDYLDWDGDGYGNPNIPCVYVNEQPGCVSDNTDCDDNNANVHPNATEACNGIDDDCDTVVPENEADADQDGYRVCENDCNDNDANIHPNATEACNGIDDDCDTVVPADEADADQDGFRVCENDCDDNDPNVNPGAIEACNGIDDNCDGSIDEGFPDTDNDGQADCVDPCPLNLNSACENEAAVAAVSLVPVSYTHLTLPTNREV